MDTTEEREPGQPRTAPRVDPKREAAVIRRAYQRQVQSFTFTPGQRKALNTKDA
jgi:hypothetical protein